MRELLGILLVVQGAGGLINRLVGSASESWFVQLHLLPPGLHLWASVGMVLAGAAVFFAESARKRRSE